MSHHTNVMEHKYVLADPSILKSLNPSDIEAFLKDFDRCCKMRVKDGLHAISLEDCIDSELYEALADLSPEVFYEGIPEDKEPPEASKSEIKPELDEVTEAEERKVKQLWEKKDDSIRLYLESKLQYETAEQARKAFANISMDMSFRDIHEREARYNVAFNRVCKMASNLKIRDKVLASHYVNGIRPPSVQSYLQAELDCEDTTLNSIRMKAHEELESQHKQYLRAPKPKEITERKPFVAYSKPESQIRAVRSEPRAAAANATPLPSTPGYNLRNTQRRRCNGCKQVNWSPEHWKVCPGNPHREVPAVHVVSQISSVRATEEDKEQAGAAARPCRMQLWTPLNGSINQVRKIRGPIKVQIDIGGTKYPAVIDTGASISCIARSMVNKLSKEVEITSVPTFAEVELADSRRIQTRGVSLTFTMVTPRALASCVTVKWCFAELPDDNNERILIGTDLMEELGMVQDGMLIIPVDRSDEIETHNEEEEEDDLVAAVLGPSISLNGLQPADRGDIEGQVPATEGEDEGLEYLKVVVPPSDVAEGVREIVKEYADVFSKTLPAEGSLLPPMPIKLMRDEVIRVPVRRLRADLRQEVEQQLAASEKMGLIGPTMSMYASPVTAAWKKDGTVRVCFDYSAINAIIEPYIYPIANMQSIIDKQAGGLFYGTGDMRCGFNQMSVLVDARPYTAVMTEDRKFECKTAFFGMRNTPSYFQCGMDRCMEDLINAEDFGVYIDDTVFNGATKEQFLNRLQLYLDRCRRWRLRLKAEKCIFGASSVEVLGCILSKEGRRMSKARIEAVTNLPKPEDIHELRMFLGQGIFFQDYIPNLHILAAPLYELLKKGVAWCWQEQHQKAFEDVKTALTSDTILAYPSDPGQLVLRTDASALGAGGVLLLRKAGVADRPVCYFSHKFSEAQRKWSTYDQELFAIIYCLTRKPYAELFKLTKFVVETDHRNLQYLSSIDGDNKNTRIQRWRTFLLQFVFEIHHIAGTTNVVADCLSRFGFSSKNIGNVAGAVFVAAAVSVNDGMNEVFWKALKEYQRTMPPEERKGYHEGQDGWLYNSAERILIPDQAKDLRQQVLKASHGTPLSGHNGQRRVADIIRRGGFDWPALDEDVRSFIESCPVCQKTRLRRHVVTEMRTTADAYPFHTLAVDSMGPFTPDDDGNAYLIVMVDVATRVTRIKVAKTTDAKSAANAVLTEVVARIGLPRYIRSDNGPQYANELVDTLCDMLKMKHHRVLPYQPTSNGVVERTNEEVIRHLRCLFVDFRRMKNWSALVPFVEHIINNSVHSSLGVSPNTMLYGNMVPSSAEIPRMILDFDASSVGGKAREYVRNLQNQLMLIRNAGLRVQAEVIEKRLDGHNLSLPTTFVPGELVLVQRHHDDEPGKMDPMYLGPYKVISEVAPGVFELQHLFDVTRVIKIHQMRLRPFVLRDDVSQKDLENLVAGDDAEFLVEKVMSHTGYNKRDIRFTIRWLGYGPESDTIEPWSHVEGNTVVEAYIQANPELLHLLRDSTKRRSARAGGVRTRLPSAGLQ